VPSGPSHANRRNPFDSAVAPGRSLADRITVPANRSRSDSPIRHSDVSGPPPSNVDRYVPGRGSRSRSPRPRRDGRRPGARRERGDRRGGGGRGGSERVAKDGRPKKTQEELDAEMDDYWGAKDNGAETSAAPATSAQDDIDMIE
jgi:THO complex subunit 4